MVGLCSRRCSVYQPRGSLEQWLGRGRPLNPDLGGIILDLLRDEAEGNGVKDFRQWKILRVWVRDWLRYCQWYYCTALSPDANIEQFFDAPVVMNHWKIKRTTSNSFWSYMEDLRLDSI
jgi:hypothetical protein